MLWLLDHLGRREWIDDPIGHQRELLPMVRLGSLWIWLVAIGTDGRVEPPEPRSPGDGPGGLALRALPNLIAHGTLATMELPLVAATTAMFWFFWRFLDSKRWPWFWASAAAAGLAFSCKFTAIVFPPILAVVWWLARWQGGETRAMPAHLAGVVADACASSCSCCSPTSLSPGLRGFPSVPLRDSTPASRNGWARRRPGEVARLYETPLPQDWVGFATQMHHQASGGASYLWGERRMKGWWYYYFVALAVKVPLGFWLLVVARLVGSCGHGLASRPDDDSGSTFVPPLRRGETAGEALPPPRTRHDRCDRRHRISTCSPWCSSSS